MYVVETSAPAETEALGSALADGLRGGDVVLVEGELGVGKTTFVRGAARRLGVSDAVTSPTFAIGHRYRATDVTVTHLDLYRLASLASEDPGLLDDYLGPDRIAFVEWPHAGGAELGSANLRVVLSHRGGDRRRIEVCDSREQVSDVEQKAVRDGAVHGTKLNDRSVEQNREQNAMRDGAAHGGVS